jgi:hypothetical protein
VGRTDLAADSGFPAARVRDRISITSALYSSTVFHVIKTGRKVAAAGALIVLFAVWAPLSAFACSTGTSGGGGGTYGGGSASGGGSALATGGGSAVPVGSIGFGGMTFAALSGFVLLAAVVVLAILLVKTLRRPRPNWALMAQLSPDGRYWWDGTTWHDGLQNPPPPSVRSADGAHWWDGGSWRLVPVG